MIRRDNCWEVECEGCGAILEVTHPGVYLECSECRDVAENTDDLRYEQERERRSGWRA